jgi:hypothetical protein
VRRACRDDAADFNNAGCGGRLSMAIVGTASVIGGLVGAFVGYIGASVVGNVGNPEDSRAIAAYGRSTGYDRFNSTDAVAGIMAEKNAARGGIGATLGAIIGAAVAAKIAAPADTTSTAVAVTP